MTRTRFGNFDKLSVLSENRVHAIVMDAAAVAIGFINMCANLAGFAGNRVVGLMRDAGLSDRACLTFLAASFAFGAVFISMIRVPPHREPPA